MKSIYRIFIVAVAVIAVALMHSPQAIAQSGGMVTAHGPEVLAIVDGDSISTEDLTAIVVEVHRNTPIDQRANFDYHKLMDKLVNDRLIIHEAIAMGMDQEQMIVAPVEKFRMSQAVSTFVAARYQPEIDVTEQAVKDRFDKNYKRAEVRTLAVTTIERARELRQEILDGAPMDSLAELFSIDSRKDHGGLHKEMFWKDILVSLREAAGNLEVGQLSEPFMFEGSYMILRLESLTPADPEILGHAKATIERSILLDERKRAWEGFLDSLRTLYPITLHDSTINRIKADSIVLMSEEFTIDSDAPVISIKGMPPIPEGRFRKELSHKAMTAAEAGFRTQVETTIKALSEDYLLEAGATKAGYLQAPSVVAQCDRMSDSLLIDKYLQENVATRILFEDDSLKAIYDENPDQWVVHGDVKLDVLLCADQATADKALASLLDGANYDYVNERFGILENQYSATADRWRELSSLPNDLAVKLVDLSVGGFADGTYQLQDGWGIFRLAARKPDRYPSYQEVEGSLKTVLFQRQFNRLMDELLDTLKANADVVIYEDRIAKFLEG